MNYYNEIKTELLNNEINKRIKSYSINKSDLSTYYNVGKFLSEAGKQYGKNVVKDYSQKLQTELGKRYSVRLLYKMLKYYNFVSNKKLPTLSAKLSWSHYDEILKFDNINKIIYYINVCEQYNLSVRELRSKIKNGEYERLPEETKNKLSVKEEAEVKDLIKNPIIIKNKKNYEIISEKILQKLILEDIESFMKELGNSFCFMGSEYKIKLGDKYNYIDLLLYNVSFKCYVVVELKVTELKKEHIGQIQTYMNYIDKKLKTIEENKTVGIIIVKKNDRFLMEYCSDGRIITREFSITRL